MDCHVNAIFGGLGFRYVFILMSPTTHVVFRKHGLTFRGVWNDVVVDILYVQWDVITGYLHVNIDIVKSSRCLCALLDQHLV